jgi:predicted nucleic acid-binding protein
VPEALSLLEAVTKGEVEVLQPPHWILEVAAVLARKAPANADEALDFLEDLAFERLDTRSVLRRARQLATELNHHLFDTLYHAVAIEGRATLITADSRYLTKIRERQEARPLALWDRA